MLKSIIVLSLITLIPALELRASIPCGILPIHIPFTDLTISGQMGWPMVVLVCTVANIVLGWGASSRIVTLKLSIDGEPVGSFMCDGMMVSTPTGSTGHSLSAGGPILHPGIGGFGINVICPHTLSSRPLVVPNSSLIEVEVVNAAKELILSIDGQDEYKMEQGGRIAIRRSPHPVQFLQLPGLSYFSVLAQKLHWRGSSL